MSTKSIDIIKTMSIEFSEARGLTGSASRIMGVGLRRVRSVLALIGQRRNWDGAWESASETKRSIHPP
jgi:hypothetical protein